MIDGKKINTCKTIFFFFVGFKDFRMIKSIIVFKKITRMNIKFKK